MMSMKLFEKYILSLFVGFVLLGCSARDDIESGASNGSLDACELQGVEAIIVGSDSKAATRGTVTALADYVGRNKFVANDRIVFTKIHRTQSPLTQFTYPGAGYDGLAFLKETDDGGWKRSIADAAVEPDRIYWTDASNPHTFVAYCIPQKYYESGTSYDWVKTSISGSNYYIGSLGVPTETGIIDYSLTSEEQESYKTGTSPVVYSNPKLEKEDLLIAYDENMVAEPGGSVALVKFYHALSSVRVVVNISGFASSSTADDNKTVVSEMVLKNQPTMYFWAQSDPCAHQLRNLDGAGAIQNYKQVKDLKLWIPNPQGTGTNQSKIFTFYGITTPHDNASVDTMTFKVTYPDPMQPENLSAYKVENYTATISGVDFRAGYNTTINISLNHKNEYITVGAEYENWQFVATPDAGELKKNSTFLQSTARTDVTIVGDANATIDDATWLYELNGTVRDIYGNDGSNEDKAYKICTAYQLLSFAYEVANKRDFSGKFIRLDADITLQKSSDKTKEEIEKIETEAESKIEALDWIGIGTADHPFKGTFIGGGRYIYRLNGSPLFKSIGKNATIEQLTLTAIKIEDDGSGAIANTNAGKINGCNVRGDVFLNGTTAGAFVGTNTNTGTIHACYHIGDTESTVTEGNITLGGLVGSNSGTISNCYHAGKVMRSTTSVSGTVTTGGITGSGPGTLQYNYYNSSMLTPTYIPESGVTGKSSAEMTKAQFVTDINADIGDWEYVYQQANYPIVKKKLIP